ncbi:hypothetical protein [Sinomonas mesophila]|uniref:hypothetical protein n=1 Tax=Sinomonas mesophila TaxID=1531955 RepID=UPI001115A253|nr:hypothetical protein [Sinomonas mesophila]
MSSVAFSAPTRTTSGAGTAGAGTPAYDGAAPARLRGRLAAAAAAAGAAAHLAMVPSGGWMAALGLAMAAACVPCAWHLWRRPAARTARALLGMSLAMVFIHAVLVLRPEPAAAHGVAAHAHAQPGGAGVAPVAGHPVAGHPTAGHAEAMLAVVGADLLAAFLAAAWLGAARRARPQPAAPSA